MANALDRKIEQGETVMLNSGMAFRCDGGFGLLPNTAGVAIYGQFAPSGKEGLISGLDIDAKATRALQEAEANDAPGAEG